MTKEKEIKVSLTALEMKLILDTVNASTYQGTHSDLVSSVREKMKAKTPKED